METKGVDEVLMWRFYLVVLLVLLYLAWPVLVGIAELFIGWRKDLLLIIIFITFIARQLISIHHFLFY